MRRTQKMLNRFLFRLEMIAKNCRLFAQDHAIEQLLKSEITLQSAAISF